MGIYIYAGSLIDGVREMSKCVRFCNVDVHLCTHWQILMSVWISHVTSMLIAQTCWQGLSAHVCLGTRVMDLSVKVSRNA